MEDPYLKLFNGILKVFCDGSFWSYYHRNAFLDSNNHASAGFLVSPQLSTKRSSWRKKRNSISLLVGSERPAFTCFQNFFGRGTELEFEQEDI